MSDVVTGEAVALDLRLAQLPSRLTAAVLDLAVMAAAYGVILVIMFQAGLSGADDALLGGVAVSLLVLVFLVYPVAMETLTRGRSLGKMALGLRVVRDDGGPITFRQALVRGLVGLALERPGIFLGTIGPAVGMVVAMFSSRGKRLGDMAAGTVVLQERVPTRPLWTPVMPPPLAAWAPTLDLAGFDDALALSVRQFLDRAGELVPMAREALAAELVDEVRSRTTPDPPPGTPGWAYLTAILAERRRREEDRALRAAGRPGLPPGWYPGWPMPSGGYAGGPGPYGAPGPGQAAPYGAGQPGPYVPPSLYDRQPPR
ncbi:MAG TPA: RDD family protein [Mycobacteriales bacterium]|nr:RDD family protein [Mycobacteriales bacterium]